MGHPPRHQDLRETRQAHWVREPRAANADDQSWEYAPLVVRRKLRWPLVCGTPGCLLGGGADDPPGVALDSTACASLSPRLHCTANFGLALNLSVESCRHFAVAQGSRILCGPSSAMCARLRAVACIQVAVVVVRPSLSHEGVTLRLCPWLCSSYVCGRCRFSLFRPFVGRQPTHIATRARREQGSAAEFTQSTTFHGSWWARQVCLSNLLSRFRL